MVVAGVSEANDQHTLKAIHAEVGAEASVFIGDATSDDDSRAMIAAAVERYGGLHVLVNDLGFGGRSVNWGAARGLTDLEESTWNWAMDLNLRSAMLASKHAIAPMTAAGGDRSSTCRRWTGWWRR